MYLVFKLGTDIMEYVVEVFMETFDPPLIKPIKPVPTPYSVDPDFPNHVLGPDGLAMCVCDQSGATKAAFIVKACNNHDALVRVVAKIKRAEADADKAELKAFVEQVLEQAQ